MTALNASSETYRVRIIAVTLVLCHNVDACRAVSSTGASAFHYRPSGFLTSAKHHDQLDPLDRQRTDRSFALFLT
ncbi:hypothetical protein H920_12629 [Fukomys damarensis]|uniref:Uncharacterized protein n=1 Tax=Fukomys damarensis TaxID=885580 RepID=A0A091DT48_FUKDA|nr:hypothetical protein H920_12629 [Fukomys damarensis]